LTVFNFPVTLRSHLISVLITVRPLSSADERKSQDRRSESLGAAPALYQREVG
jgi:hypothetical protein